MYNNVCTDFTCCPQNIGHLSSPGASQDLPKDEKNKLDDQYGQQLIWFNQTYQAFWQSLFLSLLHLLLLQCLIFLKVSLVLEKIVIIEILKR